MGSEAEYGLFFPGMDIPKSCVGCPAVYYELIALAYNPDETTKTKIWCRSAKREVVEINKETGKPDWCPARCLRWKIVQDFPISCSAPTSEIEAGDGEPELVLWEDFFGKIEKSTEAPK